MALGPERARGYADYLDSRGAFGDDLLAALDDAWPEPPTAFAHLFPHATTADLGDIRRTFSPYRTLYWATLDAAGEGNLYESGVDSLLTEAVAVAAHRLGTPAAVIEIPCVPLEEGSDERGDWVGPDRDHAVVIAISTLAVAPDPELYDPISWRAMPAAQAFERLAALTRGELNYRGEQAFMCEGIEGDLLWPGEGGAGEDAVLGGAGVVTIG